MFLYALKKFLIVFSMLLLSGGIFVGIIDFQNRATGYRGPISDHFDGKHFYNIGESYLYKESSGLSKLYDIYSWITDEKPQWEMHHINSITPVEKYSGNGVKITYIGHATTLIQINGVNILTDPIWSYHPSPISGIGHGRYINPGIDFSKLPKINIIILSHNHYDHLDIPTLQTLSERDAPSIYTGLGNSEYLREYGVNNSRDMDWYDTINLSGSISLTYVPAQHYSARAISDRNTTLWGGFVIEGAGKHIYFAGDTGYGDFIEKIKEKYPNGFDIGLLPIGAYSPPFIMQKDHMNPYEALKMQQGLSIKTAISIHWGTFSLASDKQDDSMKDLSIARALFPNLDFRAEFPGTEWIFE